MPQLPVGIKPQLKAYSSSSEAVQAIRTPGTDATAVPAARDFAIATVQRWGGAERSGDVVVVSELLANALRHALPGPVRAENLVHVMRPGDIR
jgi:hypothetical protein